MRDFSLRIYRKLLLQLRNQGYGFQTVEEFIANPSPRVVILRHDVDLRNWAASRLAKCEHDLKIKSTYYFRVVKQSYNPRVIREIVKLGHEIGYHYEDLAKSGGNTDEAIRSFESNLKLFRRFYPVTTACMHGSSGSPYDNRDLWKSYNLQDFGLICEPYLSIDYNKVLYLSDTGRRWNGFRMSLRDNVKTNYDYNFYSTDDVISAVGKLPDQILFTAHPEQWTDNLAEWLFVRLFSLAHTFYKVHYRNKRIQRNQEAEKARS